MAQTNFPIGHPMAVQRYAGALFQSTMAATYFGQHMMEDAHAVGKSGQMANAPVVVINDLTNEAGDTVSFDLFVQLTGRATYGDDIIENNLEDLTAYTDEIRINQVRKGVDSGGKMTQKRVLTDLRMTAKQKLEDYFAAYFDQSGLTTLAGGRGISPELYIPLGATAAVDGGSPYESYDSGHIVYGGDAVGKTSIEAADKMSLDVVDRLILKAGSTGGGADGVMRMTPLKKDGEDAFVLLMSPRQEHDLRKDVGNGGWVDLQKAAAGATGNGSHLFKNVLGVHRGVHMRKHQHVVQFDDYGVGANVRADRASFMGRQALAVAFGSANSKGLRADWVEEKKDFGNRMGVVGGMVYSFKLPKFNNKVVNSYAVDTAVTTAA